MYPDFRTNIFYEIMLIENFLILHFFYFMITFFVMNGRSLDKDFLIRKRHAEQLNLHLQCFHSVVISFHNVMNSFDKLTKVFNEIMKDFHKLLKKYHNFVKDFDELLKSFQKILKTFQNLMIHYSMVVQIVKITV